MNYYKRHLGDYAKDTKHLSLAEHGAYTLLLDYYYATEKPIPDDRCERIANAYANEERQAVQNVLHEFFQQTPDGWLNPKAEEVIAEARDKSLKAKESAENRWMRTQCERNANAYANASKTQCERNASHKPLAISKEKAKATVQQAARFPDFWAAYPNKKGKADALRKWKARGLDPMADALIAHVARMLAEDDGWRRGFVPMGSTYINGERWQDEPQRPTQAAPAGKPEPVCNPAGVSPRITDKTEERRREAEALAAMNRQLKDLGVSPNA